MKLLFCLFWFACATQSAVKTDDPSEISLQDFYPLSKTAIIIDVRTQAEFQSGHVPGARNIPLNELPDKISSLTADRIQPVYFICASGVRSAKATQLARSQGYTKAINIKDGTYGWTSAGFPLE